MTETMFLSTYGSPWLQALVGLRSPAGHAAPHRTGPRAGSSPARARAELEHRFEVGGLAEAVMRALIYIRMPEGSVDERGFRCPQAHSRLAPRRRADRVWHNSRGSLENSICSFVSTRIERSTPCQSCWALTLRSGRRHLMSCTASSPLVAACGRGQASSDAGRSNVRRQARTFYPG